MEHKIGDRMMVSKREDGHSRFIPYTMATLVRVTSRTLDLDLGDRVVKFTRQGGVELATGRHFQSVETRFELSFGRFTQAQFELVRLNVCRSILEAEARDCKDYVTLLAAIQVLKTHRNNVADAIIEGLDGHV